MKNGANQAITIIRQASNAPDERARPIPYSTAATRNIGNEKANKKTILETMKQKFAKVKCIIAVILKVEENE
ncbi:MAG: hypothetical protein GXP33_11120 [Spirochaetes bacterium]|nr:hypothetical protein [Spirochaetota bacterium]